jgi:hypothetical protein
LAGVAFGVVSWRVEKSNLAKAGIALSILGFLIAVTYFVFLSVFKN